MRKIKEIIRLIDAGLSDRQIAGSYAVSPSTVFEVIPRAGVVNLGIGHAESLADVELEKRLYTKRNRAKGTMPEPDIEHIHLELRRKEMTLALLWEEYKEAQGYISKSSV